MTTTTQLVPTVEPNHRYEVPYPFTRADGEWFIGCGQTYDDSPLVADAMGTMIINTLNIVQPGGKFTPRIFYTMTWRTPNGEEIGSPGVLRSDTLGALAKRLRGFRRPFTLAAALPLQPAAPRSHLTLVRTEA